MLIDSNSSNKRKALNSKNGPFNNKSLNNKQKTILTNSKIIQRGK